jgi:hypothetical protein
VDDLADIPRRERLREFESVEDHDQLKDESGVASLWRFRLREASIFR